MDIYKKFPIGGRRVNVSDFLRGHGFVLVYNDKVWARADGLQLHIYGSGSKARIYGLDNKILADDDLDVAVNSLEG